MFNQNQESGAPLPVFCVYFNPSDYPKKYVVRRWLGMDPDREPVVIADTLDEARTHLRALNPNLVHLSRQAEDDPVILETWV